MKFTCPNHVNWIGFWANQNVSFHIMERGLMFKIKQRKSFNKLSRQLKITCWVLFAKPSWFQVLSFLNLFKCSSFFSGVVGETSTGDVTHYWGGKQQQRSLAIKAPCRQRLTIYFAPLKGIRDSLEKAPSRSRQCLLIYFTLLSKFEVQKKGPGREMVLFGHQI